MQRLLNKIKLTSPSGKSHTAKWVGNDVSIKKKVATFDYPDVDGVTVQDLGLSLEKFPLTFMFDGVHHTNNSQNFIQSWSEKGVWTVLHPVLGSMELQPLSATLKVNPVKNQFLTTVTSEWIKPRPQYDGLSFLATESLIQASAAEVVLLSVENLGDGDGDGISDAGERASFITFIRSVIDRIRSALSKFYNLTSKVRQFIAQKLDAISNMLDAAFLVASIIVSAIITVIQLPATIAMIVSDKIAYFSTLFDSFDGMMDVYQRDGTATTINSESYVAVQSGVISGACISTTTGTVLSRDVAVEISRSTYLMYNLLLLRVDSLEAQLTARLSKDSYLGSLNDYDSVRNLVGRTVGYVLDDNYSQKIKKVISTDSFVATDMFASEQYPDLSIPDAFQFLIDTNNLSGNDIVWLPIGKEIVLYV